MATTAAPYGLRPVKRVDGMPYAGAYSTYLIDPAGYNTNIFNGSVVYVNANGYINIVTGTGADATTNDWPTGSTSVTGGIGVFVGCSFINGQGQLIFSQYYPSGTTGVVQALFHLQGILKLADFGLARAISINKNGQPNRYTNRVVTLW